MNIQYNRKDYQIIDSIGDLSIGKFLHYNSLKDEFKQGTLTDTEFIIQVIELISDLTEEDLLKMELSSFNEIYNYTLTIIKEPLSETYNNQDIVIDNVSYRFDTKLDVMNAGMWFDVNRLMEKGFWESADQLAGLLIREVTPEGNITPYDVIERKQRAKLFFDKLLMNDFNPISVFFCAFIRELLKMSSQPSTR